MASPLTLFEEKVLGFAFTYAELVLAIAALLIGLTLGRVFSAGLRRLLIATVPVGTLRMVEQIANYTVVIIATMVALSILHVPMEAALVAGGFFGIIIGFATQSIVANALSGVFLHLDRAVQIGDPIEIPSIGVAGAVTDITAFSTRIRTWDGIYVRIPNDKVFTSMIRNFTRHAARRIEFRVGIAYKEDVARAIQVIKDSLQEHPLVLDEPEPLVFVDTLGDSSVILNVFCWAPSPVFFTVRTQVIELVKKALDEAKIEIPLPQRVVWLQRPVEPDAALGT